MSKVNRWSKEEKEIILETLKIYKDKGVPFADAFDNLPNYLPGRTREAIRNHWNKKMSKQYPDVRSVSRVPDWTDVEEKLVVDTIVSMVSNGEEMIACFTRLSELLPKREMYAIRFRWYDKLKAENIERYNQAIRRTEKEVVVKEITMDEETEIIKMSEEYRLLEEQNKMLRAQNVTLSKDMRYLEEDFDIMVKKYNELSKVLAQVKSVITNGEIAVAIESPEQLDTLKFHMERNGKLLKAN